MLEKNKMLASDSNSLSNHDSKGNLISYWTQTYTYNQNNQLIKLTKGPEETTYQYDSEGKRTQKQTSTQTTHYLYDQTGHLLSEIEGHNYIDYIYLGDKLIARGETTIEPICNGDLNQDGSITPSDALMAFKWGVFMS